uniref:5-hydroxytryptamine receptor 3D n=1 Tax=Saimiri boliviensis boliviensis TaxID=39432 RepID=A0A2K6S5P1_SAIBB
APPLSESLLTVGKGNTFMINCLAVFDRKAFSSVTNYSVPTHVNSSFTLCFSRIHTFNSMSPCTRLWHNQFMWWNPDERGGIKKSSRHEPVASRCPHGAVGSHIRYSKPMQWSASANWTASISPSMHGAARSPSLFGRQEFLLLGPGQIPVLALTCPDGLPACSSLALPPPPHQAALRRRPSSYVINLLVPPSGGVLVAVDALSFHLPLGGQNPTSTPFISTFSSIQRPKARGGPSSPAGVFFALCLSLMVLSLLETVFITHLLHVATTQSPPLPRWLHSLLLSCTSPGRCCPTAPQKRNEGLGLTPTHLPGAKEPEVSAGQRPGPGVAEPTGGSEWTRVQREHGAQRQRSVALWVQFSHAMDALLFRLYLLFLASSILTVVGLWNT